MEAVAKILNANLAEPLPGERAGAISSTFPDNEYRYACSRCKDQGWRPANESSGVVLCECVIAKKRTERLSAIPDRFKDSTFESYRPRNHRQEQALFLMRGEPAGSWYLTGSYGSGKTHLLYAQYRQVVLDGKIRCHVRTTRELVEELRRAELNKDFVSPVMAAVAKPGPYHFFWDDIDKLKPTDFKTEVLFDLVDTLYRQKHGLTVTGNYSMRDLVEQERMHPAIVRRLDDICRVIQI
jgi:DNA replication protein DnaC